MLRGHPLSSNSGNMARLNRKGVPTEFPKLINRANGLMKPIMVSKEGHPYRVFDQAPSALERTEFVLIWRVLRVP